MISLQKDSHSATHIYFLQIATPYMSREFHEIWQNTTDIQLIQYQVNICKKRDISPADNSKNYEKTFLSEIQPQ